MKILKKQKKFIISLVKKEKHIVGIQQNNLQEFIYRKRERKKLSKFFLKLYDNLIKKEIYETFDYAEFLKNNEKFKESIKFYSEIIIKLKIIILYMPKLPMEEV